MDAVSKFQVVFYQTKVNVQRVGPDGKHVDACFTIGRTTGEIYTNNEVERKLPQRVVDAVGILGMIKLQSGQHLIIITKQSQVGVIRGQPVYKVDETQILPLSTHRQALTKETDQVEEKYQGLIKQALSIKSYFYSPGYDLTSSIQRQQHHHQQQQQQQLWERADDRFFFNRYVSEPLIQASKEHPQVARFIIPVINGYFEQVTSSIKDQSFKYTLVTRRSRMRQGTRYFSRGADEDGNVSNFAETEQIVELESAPLKGGVLSHVQIRGSVPIDWYQNINLKYIPTLLINIEQSTDRFFRHFDRVIKDYRNVYAVNLVNKAKYEKPIGDQFTRLSREYANSQRGDEKGAESGRLYYTHFDFHKECSKMRWHRISLLIDEISGKLEEFGYYYQDPKGDVIHHQTGVIRTNCMDCLDRTNVVQSVVARFILTAQFRELEVLSSNETFDMFPQLEGMMRNIWADNADAVSCAYSGTGALKTDFTRTGKRTKIGAIQDGCNSIERYIRGNFLDGVRQDAMDLFLGKAQVVYGSDPFKRQLSLQCKMLLACLVVSLLMVVIGVIYAPFGYFTLKSTAFVVSWEGVTYLVAREVMKSHAAEVLNWPSLVPYPYRPQAVHVGEGLRVPIIGHYLENGLGAASTAADSTLTSQSSKPKRA